MIQSQNLWFPKYNIFRKLPLVSQWSWVEHVHLPKDLFSQMETNPSYDRTHYGSIDLDYLLAPLVVVFSSSMSYCMVLIILLPANKKHTTLAFRAPPGRANWRQSPEVCRSLGQLKDAEFGTFEWRSTHLGSFLVDMFNKSYSPLDDWTIDIISCTNEGTRMVGFGWNSLWRSCATLYWLARIRYVHKWHHKPKRTKKKNLSNWTAKTRLVRFRIPRHSHVMQLKCKPEADKLCSRYDAATKLAKKQKHYCL